MRFVKGIRASDSQYREKELGAIRIATAETMIKQNQINQRPFLREKRGPTVRLSRLIPKIR